MEPKIKLTEEAAWKELEAFFNANGKSLNISNLFKEDPDRFQKFR